MKTINFELSKRLYDNWLLSFNWLDYSRYFRIDSEWNSLAICKHNDDYNEYLETYKEYPSLTLEEAIEFLPIQINNYYFVFWKNDNWYWCNYLEKDEDELYILGNALLKNICNEKTPLEAIEKMLEYLLEENLI